jgi:hypothetical protein
MSKPKQDDIEMFGKEDSKLDDVLFGDLEIVSENLSRHDSQFWRRAYCRALISMFEGVLHRLSMYTLTFYDGMLGEDEKRELTRRHGALDQAFHTLDLYTNVSGADTPLKRNTEEWLILKKAVKIRNRITHPTSAENSELSDLDMAHLRVTAKVIMDLLCQSQLDVARALLRKQKTFQRAWKKARLTSESCFSR